MSVIDLLRDVRVLECAMLFNGDQTGRILGDLGADVIKVEAPGRGDYLRDFLGQITPRNSVAHLYANRNKRSVTLNLKSDEGRALFFRLLETADIFVDGFAGDACNELGIGYEAQRAVKPDIIYAQCSGFGAHGSLSRLPTHGMMMGSLGGGARLRVNEEGLAEELGGLTDGTMVGATATALTAVSALVRRARTGAGCYVDGAGSDAVLATEWFRPTYYWNADRIVDRSGMFDPSGRNPKYSYYVTKDDKYVMFCAIEPKFWRNFCVGADREDLLDVHDAGVAVDYSSGGDALVYALRDLFRTRTQQEWTDLAVAHDVPLGPANQVEDLRDDAHLRDRGIVHDSEHPVAGSFTSVGWPALVSGQRFDITRHAPAVGEHTSEVLSELGVSEIDLAELGSRHII
jgi:crotonobetainyl-CoA:carnitine CoA-transferase CaiB-like acyl-CoA transferase